MVVAWAGTAEAAGRPNVVVVMADDQDLRSLREMDAVERLIAQRGTTFENHFATYPLCCPSRATFLTGQYAGAVLSDGRPVGSHGEPNVDARRNPRPAPRHHRAYEDAPLPTPPSFNEREMSDKPPWMRDRPRLNERDLRERHQDRLASLLAVDDLVAGVVKRLRRTGELARERSSSSPRTTASCWASTAPRARRGCTRRVCACRW
jgi:arylsulfatase A-like enzyme